jgi:hypothetical protein
MSTIRLRLPESLHMRIRELGKKEGVSIIQIITSALAEQVSALMTLEYLEERAKRGNRMKFDWTFAGPVIPARSETSTPHAGKDQVQCPWQYVAGPA